MRPFALAIVLCTGACAGAPPPPTPPPASGTTVEADESASAVWRFLRTRYDVDRDGRVTRAEYPRAERGFRNLDVTADGVVSAADFDPRFDTVLRGPWASFEELEYGEGGPQIGDPAPPIRLSDLEGRPVDLASVRGQRPVALVFGSFT